MHGFDGDDLVRQHGRRTGDCGHGGEHRVFLELVLPAMEDGRALRVGRAEVVDDHVRPLPRRRSGEVPVSPAACWIELIRARSTSRPKVTVFPGQACTAASQACAQTWTWVSSAVQSRTRTCRHPDGDAQAGSCGAEVPRLTSVEQHRPCRVRDPTGAEPGRFGGGVGGSQSLARTRAAAQASGCPRGSRCYRDGAAPSARPEVGRRRLTTKTNVRPSRTSCAHSVAAWSRGAGS